LVHNALDNHPNGFEQANAVVVTAGLWDQDYDDPSKLLGYYAHLPDCSDQLHQQASQVPRAVIALALLWVLFPPYLLEPLLDVLSTHHQSAIGQGACGAPHFQAGGRVVWNLNRSDFMRRGSPGEGLHVYYATCSAIWHSIV
jgi:hypothetical protein